ncbi:MAG: endonuclease domain-containing protein [Gammaproteobacteria bacterium]|nr:endonuclease domain-containing protein [Gammaproteobacteria bacterium]
MLRISPTTKSNSRNLRKNMTDAERMLWAKIRGRQLQGFHFRRQHPIGDYIVDFICLELKLIIELDGSQHMEQQQYDMKRSQWLLKNGFKVIRFWNNEVFDDLDGVMHAIYGHLPPSQPSPLKGEGV